MADPKGFQKFRRSDPIRRDVMTRVQDWNELYQPISEEDLRAQATRCMDCGVPFCQSKAYGCPVENFIPDWNDLVHAGRWKEALVALHRTNNFPEFTGRLCPAPCESACVLGINDSPVSIRVIEWNIIEKGFAEGWVSPETPAKSSGKHVGIIGSGPAGLAAAQQLRRAGHRVTVYEKADRIGGLLRYGIPDFKMEKQFLDRRLAQLLAEGVEFKTGVHIGVDVPFAKLRSEHDALCIMIGAEAPRDLSVPGRELGGVHFAMDYLTPSKGISAKNKRVIILGGGDTGSDCLGTAHRQGCSEVYQFELMPAPPEERAHGTPWPLWPMKLRTSHAHEEGGHRDWNVATTALSGEDGIVKKLHAQRVEFSNGGFIPLTGSAFEIEADLVLLAMGFTGPTQSGLIPQAGIQTDPRGNVIVDQKYQTNLPGVFAAGDAKRGASLIVWAIAEGRKAAENVDRYLSPL